MERILFINTSGTAGTVTIVADGKIVGTHCNNEPRDHAAFLNPAIEKLMREADWTLADINAVCVMAGPGSYTGLRIGLAAAKGICYALDLPLYLQNNLEVLAFAARNQQKIAEANYYVPLLRARAGEFFIAVYDQEGNEINFPQHNSIAAVRDLCNELLNSVLLCRDPGIVEEIFGENVPTTLQIEVVEDPDIQSTVHHGLTLIQAAEPVSLESAAPFYLKSPFTTTPAGTLNASH